MHPYMTMTEMAALELRKSILGGKYPPETRLIPARLVEELGLGLAAVREALRELVGSGLIDSYSNKGYFVAATPTLKELEAIFRMRFIAEKEAAQEGASRISTDDLAKMEKLHEEISEAKSPQRYWILNREFHLTLVNASGMKFLCKMIEQLFDSILIFRGIIGGFRENYDEAILHHEQIIAAIKAGNAEAVGDLMVSNIHIGLNDILDATT